MQVAIKAAALALFAGQTDAMHPLLKDQPHYQHADGSVTQRLTSKKGGLNKHANTMSQDVNFEPYPEH